MDRFTSTRKFLERKFKIEIDPDPKVLLFYAHASQQSPTATYKTTTTTPIQTRFDDPELRIQFTSRQQHTEVLLPDG